MKTHLNDDERIEALEGTLDHRRRAHLEACADCRQEVAAAHAMWEVLAADAGAGDDVPEPTPVFWNQLQARVGRAVDAQHTPWWRGAAAGWMSLAAAAVLLLVVSSGLLQRAPMPDAVVGDVMEHSAVSAIGETAQWQFVTDVLATLEDDAVLDVLRPSRGAVDAALETLTAAERDEFVRLLQAEMTEGSE